MKNRGFVLAWMVIVSGALALAGCPGKNNPTSPGDNTPTPTSTSTFANTSTNTGTPTPSNTPTITATFTVTNTFTVTATNTKTSTPTPTFTNTITATPTHTNTPVCSGETMQGFYDTSMTSYGQTAYGLMFGAGIGTLPTGLVGSASVYATQAGGHVAVGIYAADPTTGLPSTLLDSSASTALSAGWNKVTFSSTLSVGPGTNYYIEIETDSTASVGYFFNGGCNNDVGESFGTWPSTWPGTSSNQNCGDVVDFNVYLNECP